MARSLSIFLLLLSTHLVVDARARPSPSVDSGLFVILGVRTCGGGEGYCLLGSDCTLDSDFEYDTVGGHCAGLKHAFKPAAHFVCCKYVERSNTTLPGEPGEYQTTDDPVSTTDQDGNFDSSTEETTKPMLSDNNTTTESISIATEPEYEKKISTSGISGIVDNFLENNSGLELDTHVLVSDSVSIKKESVKERPILTTFPHCSHNSSDVNSCWRISFVDKKGGVLCSGSLFSDHTALTTAVCANRLMDADMTSVTVTVGGNKLPVRDVLVHQEYGLPITTKRAINDIAIVRLGQSTNPNQGCIACLPSTQIALEGKTCYALAARLHGPTQSDTSAICRGTVVAFSDGLLKLSGCEVASLKSSGTVSPAVLAREGAALLCDGLLVGLASTAVGSYMQLALHRQWISSFLRSKESGPSQNFLTHKATQRHVMAKKIS